MKKGADPSHWACEGPKTSLKGLSSSFSPQRRIWGAVVAMYGARARLAAPVRLEPSSGSPTGAPKAASWSAAAHGWRLASHGLAMAVQPDSRVFPSSVVAAASQPWSIVTQGRQTFLCGFKCSASSPRLFLKFTDYIFPINQKKHSGDPEEKK